MKDRKVLVLGDSHARIFKNHKLLENFNSVSFDVLSVDGATLSGLKNPNSKTGTSEKLKNAISDFKGDSIITLLGEVDCGFLIWFYSERDKTDPKKAAEKAILNYKELLKSALEKAPVYVISAPLPTINDGCLHSDVAQTRSSISASQRERTELTLWFNSEVRSLCINLGATFIDLDGESLGKNGLIKDSLLRKDKTDHHYKASSYISILTPRINYIIDRIQKENQINTPLDLYNKVISNFTHDTKKSSDTLISDFFGDSHPPMRKLTEVALHYHKKEYKKSLSRLDAVSISPKNPAAKRIRGFWRMKLHIKGKHLRTEKEIVESWDNNKKKISVICIAYNHEDYIEDCINSILMQKTSYPFEIIIHDDASTDSTPTIIENYKEKYPNIIKTILQNENQYSKGIKPVKIALKETSGDYTSYCEGDDYWFSDSKLDIQASMIDKENLFLCYHDCITLNEITHRVNYEQNNNENANKEVALIKLSKDDILKRNIHLPRTNSIMHKSISDIELLFPPETSNIIAVDQFRSSIGALLGEYGYLSNYKASVFRINNASTWTPLSDEETNIHNCSWRAWLALYFYRKGNIELFNYYKNKNKTPQLLAVDYIQKNNMSGYYIKKFLEAIDKINNIQLKEQKSNSINIL